MLVAGVRRVAVIGAGKNAGKTTALLALCAAASVEAMAVGLVSVGLDGEARDAWSDASKPQVRLEKDGWMVTALPFATAAGRALQIVATLPIATALGPTVLARARAPLHVQLCGIGHRQDLLAAIAALAAQVPLVLVDGAYHRQMAAHPQVAQAIVVAVGAIAAPSDQDAVALAVPTLRALLVGLAGDQPESAATYVVSGALTDTVLARCRSKSVLVRDSSRILLSQAGWAAADRQGITVVASHAVPVRAVVSNPWRQPGAAIDAAAFLAQVRAAVNVCGGAGVPVIDVVAGLRAD